MSSDSVDYGALVWSDDLVLGIAEIDAQHREWIALVQAFERAVRDGGTAEEVRRTLAAAVAYTESHFADEQRVMGEAGYPFLDDHVAQHDLAWDRVHAFASADGGAGGDDALRESLADFLPQWLMLHINTADRQFARWHKGEPPCAPAGVEGRVFGDIPV
ncbi:hemerythrin [Azospirillum agricola]|uniref:bacteriohemerythrin n=1 Tax=Azospirillum agricola TaxID=1720247 RepID=UPI001AE6317F|nr:hemerythrin family protein [Azospirillum agricola]MBP2227081.1 hemerythrin [Azospirillum agricola]